MASVSTEKGSLEKALISAQSGNFFPYPNPYAREPKMV